MSFLDNLDYDQRQLLVSLPYRVGQWVSQSDTSGGDVSDEEELRVLKNLLIGFSGETFGCETVQYIISETVKQQREWPVWDKEIANVPKDCKAAVSLLKLHVDDKEVSGFKRHLMEVGEAVALAFREVENLGFLSEIRLKLLYMKQKYKAQKDGHVYKTYDEFLNISARERVALELVASSLNIDYAI